MEKLEPTNMFTYWRANPAFDPKRVPLRRRAGGPKTIILSDEQVDAMAEGLPMLRDAMCGGNPVGGSECKSGAFRLNVRRAVGWQDYM